jgi:predicted dehydrogenase
MLRFGVLGVSNFAVKKMIPAMQAARGVEVVAIASRDGRKAADAAKALGIARAVDSYEALVADRGVDAVYNPLPNHLHVPWAERAAAAGKHVLCEKPIGLDAAEARRLLAARDAAGVLVCEAAMVRLHPRWLAVRELIRKGKLGALRAVVGTFGYQLASKDNIRYDKASGGGVLYDTGFYPVTMSRFCFDAEPISAFALCDWDPERGTDRLSSAVLRFPAGHAVFTTSMEMLPIQRVQLLGSAGFIEMMNPWNAPADQATEVMLETNPTIEAPGPQRITFDAVNQYTVLVEQFARAATDSGRPGAGPVPLEDSVRNMAVLDALYKSAASGREELVAVER